MNTDTPGTWQHLITGNGRECRSKRGIKREERWAWGPADNLGDSSSATDCIFGKLLTSALVSSFEKTDKFK